MRILIVSYWFPPYNAIGAVRVGKTAKYLAALGHDVRVLTAIGQEAVPALKVELDVDRIIYTKWFDRMHFKLIEKHRGIVQQSAFTKQSAPPHGRFYNRLRLIYTRLMTYPDAYIGWYSFATQQGLKTCNLWKPNLIYASGPPYTSLLVADRLAHMTGIPWIAELRDLWTENTLRESLLWRDIFEKRLEKKVLDSATALVTVSEPLTQTLKGRYRQPVKCIMNGFDGDDYPLDARDFGSTDQLTISYFGDLYDGRRDPASLFSGIAKMQDDERNIVVSFYGKRVSEVGILADKYGIGRNVSVNRELSYTESLKAQRNSDVLLLLLWDTPQDKGVLTGKLFEYMGAKRPILCIGCDDGTAAQMIIDRKAGFVSSNSLNIKQQLKIWMSEKKCRGSIAPLAENSIQGLSRMDQASALSDFLLELLPDASDS